MQDLGNNPAGQADNIGFTPNELTLSLNKQHIRLYVKRLRQRLSVDWTLNERKSRMPQI